MGELTPAQQAALDRARAATQGAAPRPNIPEGTTLLGTFPDNGRVFQYPDGRVAAVSATGATNDPERVQAIMEAGSFEAMLQNEQDQARIDANPVAARVQEFNRGTPFIGSYLDDAVGLVSPQAGENMRQLSEAMARQNPGETAALNIAGGVAGAIPMAAAAAPSVAGALGPMTTGGRIIAGGVGGAATGAAEGAVYGFGEGRTAEERASNAGQGALWGAGLGGALGIAGTGAAAVARKIFENLRGTDVGTIARTLSISPEAAGIVRRALDVGGVDEAVAALQRGGDTAMLADAGVPARQLLDAAAQSGGRAGQTIRKAVGARTQDATGRMVGTLDRLLGRPKGEQELIDSIRVGSRPQLGPLYERAYASPIDYSAPQGRSIEALLPRIPARAMRQAEEIMAAEGVESAQGIFRIDVLPSGQERVTFERLPDVRQLHYILQGLDDVIRGADGKGRLGGTTTLGGKLTGLRTQLSNALREAVPAFGQAQDKAGDAIRRREAVQVGYDLLRPGTLREDVAQAVADMGPADVNMQGNATLPAVTEATALTPLDAERALSPGRLGQIMAGMPASERAAARQGLRAYIDDVTAAVARTVTDPDTTTREGIKILRDMSSRANRTKLSMLLGPQDAAALLRDVDEAAVAFELRAAIAENSRTAVRQTIQGGVREAAEGGIVRSLTRGEAVDSAKTLTQALTGETVEAVRLREMGLYAEIAQALTQIRGAQAQAALKSIERAMNGQPLTQAEAERIAATVLGSLALPAERGERLTLPATAGR